MGKLEGEFDERAFDARTGYGSVFLKRACWKERVASSGSNRLHSNNVTLDMPIQISIIGKARAIGRVVEKNISNITYTYAGGSKSCIDGHE